MVTRKKSVTNWRCTTSGLENGSTDTETMAYLISWNTLEALEDKEWELNFLGQSLTNSERGKTRLSELGMPRQCLENGAV